MIQLDIHVYLFFLPLTIFLTLGKILWVNSPIKCDWTIRMNGGSLGKRGFKKNKVCFLKFIFNWQIIALQYCVGFWYQQCEPAISIFMSLPLEPPPRPEPHPISLGCHWAPGWAACVIQHFLIAICFTYGSVCVSLLLYQLVPPSSSQAVSKVYSLSLFVPCK